MVNIEIETNQFFYLMDLLNIDKETLTHKVCQLTTDLQDLKNLENNLEINLSIQDLLRSSVSVEPIRGQK
jgi:hypothetical protein